MIFQTIDSINKFYFILFFARFNVVHSLVKIPLLATFLLLRNQPATISMLFQALHNL